MSRLTKIKTLSVYESRHGSYIPRPLTKEEKKRAANRSFLADVSLAKELSIPLTELRK